MTSDWWAGLLSWYGGTPPEIRALLRHPLVITFLSLGAGGLATWLLAERWQRWRQRRDFQYRAMVRLSELSEVTFGRLSELWAARGKVSPARHSELRRETVYAKGRLYAMDAECFAAFQTAEVYSGLIRLKDLAQALYQMATGPRRATRGDFEIVQSCYLAQRRVMITRMARAMRLLSWREARAVLKEEQPKTVLPDDIEIPPFYGADVEEGPAE